MRKNLFVGLALLGGFLMVQAQCKTVSALTENFDTWKDINPCWTVRQGKAMLYASEKRMIFYSMNSPGEPMFLITPKIKAGNYTLTLDSSDNGGKTTLELFSIGNTADIKSYTSIAKPSEVTGNQKAMTVTLKKDTYLGIKVLLNSTHQAVYLDNFSLKPKK